MAGQRTQRGRQQAMQDQAPSSGKGRTTPPTVQCYVCGRQFGTASIRIHEQQCLKRWRQDNDLLPSSQRAPEPVKPKRAASQDEGSATSSSSQDGEARRTRTTAPESPLFPCYLCGDTFDVNAIYKHEEQCLVRWKEDNERLPPSKRRPQPLKPDVKFTPSGGVDFVGTFHRIWDNHKAELVECKKCGRKFFPDRIEKHENVCAGLKINVKNKK